MARHTIGVTAPVPTVRPGTIGEVGSGPEIRTLTDAIRSARPTALRDNPQPFFPGEAPAKAVARRLLCDLRAIGHWPVTASNSSPWQALPCLEVAAGNGVRVEFRATLGQGRRVDPEPRQIRLCPHVPTYAGVPAMKDTETICSSVETTRQIRELRASLGLRT